MAGSPGAGSCKRVLRLIDWEQGVGLVPVEAAASPSVRTESRGGNEQEGWKIFPRSSQQASCQVSSTGRGTCPRSSRPGGWESRCLALGLCGVVDSISKDGSGRRLSATCRKHVARSGALQGGGHGRERYTRCRRGRFSSGGAVRPEEGPGFQETDWSPGRCLGVREPVRVCE